MTLLAAGMFAVALAVATFTLLHALERALTEDVRTASEAVLRRQAALVLTEGIPADSGAGGGDERPGFRAAGARHVRERSWARGALHRAMRRTCPGSTSSLTPRSPLARAPTSSSSGACRSPTPACSASTVPSRTTPSLHCTSVGWCWPRRPRWRRCRNTIATTQTMFWVVGPVLVTLIAGLAWLLAGRALRPVAKR